MSTPERKGSVLQVGPLMPSLESELSERFAAVVLPEPPDAFLAERGADVTVAVTSSGTGVGEALMSALPQLEAIVNFGVGYDTTDIDEASARGITVSNTPDVLTDCVADLAVGALIDVMRRLTAADRYVRAGSWTSGRYPLTSRVTGKRVGILGLGRIGLAIARRLEGFGVEIGYHNRRVRDVPYRYHSSLVEMARECDVLVVAAAGGDSTRGLVSAEVLDALGPRGYLVNVARGSLVDENALVAALERGALGGAALDVFADEPHVPNQLLDRDDTLLLPHIGSATHETRAAMARLALDNLEQFLADGTLLTPVPESARGQQRRPAAVVRAERRGAGEAPDAVPGSEIA